MAFLAQAGSPAGDGGFWPGVGVWLSETVKPHLGTMGLLLAGFVLLALMVFVWREKPGGVAASQIWAMVVGAFVLITIMAGSNTIEWGTIIRVGVAAIIAIEIIKALSIVGLTRLAVTSSALCLVTLTSILFYRLAVGSFEAMQWPFVGMVMGATTSYGLLRLESVLQLLITKEEPATLRSVSRAA